MQKLNPLLHQLDQELHRYLAFDNTKKVHEHLLEYDEESVSDIIPKISVTDLDIISRIANYHEIRIKELVDTVYFPQGTVSKIVNRLVKKELIRKYHRSDNKKDVYLKLTANGQIIAKLHEKYHEKENTKLNELGTNFSNSDLQKLTEILRKINELREN
ncbi:MAG: MarR family transcriptional regulator [Liquorilactobacillus sp.]|uniref:MarR family winged helix-turn-helix transcriptional regulator n=2 Tax=Liquorilactobacillus sp. TaxID=2767923 RepID=UPI0039E95981